MSTPGPQQPPNQPDPLAVALAKLDPSPHGFDWNALMFAAGRESKARVILFWRIVAGVCALAALGFASAFFFQLGAPPVERIVYIDRTAPALPKAETPAPVPSGVKPEPVPLWTNSPQPEPGAAARWYGVRNELLTVGVGALPDSDPKVPAPSSEK